MRVTNNACVQLVGCAGCILCRCRRLPCSFPSRCALPLRSSRASFFCCSRIGANRAHHRAVRLLRTPFGVVHAPGWPFSGQYRHPIGGDGAMATPSAQRPDRLRDGVLCFRVGRKSFAKRLFPKHACASEQREPGVPRGPTRRLLLRQRPRAAGEHLPHELRTASPDRGPVADAFHVPFTLPSVLLKRAQRLHHRPAWRVLLHQQQRQQDVRRPFVLRSVSGYRTVSRAALARCSRL